MHWILQPVEKCSQLARVLRRLTEKEKRGWDRQISVIVPESIYNEIEGNPSLLEVYCKLNDLDLAGIIEDAGKSGKNLNRAGIQELMMKIKNKTIDAVIVYKLDRLSRKVIDTLTLIETFEKQNIIFHSLTEKIDTGTAIAYTPYLCNAHSKNNLPGGLSIDD